MIIIKLVKQGEECFWLLSLVANFFPSVPSYLRLQTINWQDWKYTWIVAFIRHSQNIWHHNAFCEYKLYSRRRWKQWIETSFSKLIFNPFSFTSFTVHGCSFKLRKSLHHYWIYCFASVWICLEGLSRLNIIWSLHEKRWIEKQLWNWNFQFYVFDDIRNKFVSAHCTSCDFECFDCNKWNSQTMYISNLAC